MWNKLRKWMAAPTFEGDAEKTRQANVLWIVVWAALAAVPLFISTFAFGGSVLNNVALFISLGLMAVLVAILLLVRSGIVKPVGYILSITFWLAGTVAAYQFGGLREMALQFYYLVLVLAGTTIGVNAVAGFFVLSVLSQGVLFVLERSGMIQYELTPPTSYDDAATLILIFLLTALLLRNALRSLATAYTETRENAEALGAANTELEAIRDELAQQSSDLVRRASYLEATATVAQESTQLLNQPDRLFNQIVEFISGALNLYHVGMYFIDPSGEYVQLVAASSVAGKQMVNEMFRLPVSDRLADRSIAGWVAARREVYITNNVEDDPRFRVVEELPETRSEIALPLSTQGKVYGVLDIQSIDEAGFSAADAASLQVLADQVSMTINNAQLVRQLGESLEAQRRLSAEVGRENWLELIHASAETGFVGDGQGVSKVEGVWQPEMQHAINTGVAVVSSQDPRVLAIPVRARGQVVAVIDATLPETLQRWTPDAISVLEAMAEQLGTALEGARLYQQTRERAATEQVTREITASMRETLDVDGVLQAALREISTVLKVQHVEVRLGTVGEEAAG